MHFADLETLELFLIAIGVFAMILFSGAISGLDLFVKLPKQIKLPRAAVLLSIVVLTLGALWRLQPLGGDPSLSMDSALLFMGVFMVIIFVCVAYLWLSSKDLVPKIKLPRLFGLLVTNAILLAVIYGLAPHQVPVVLYKLTLITLAAYAGYWFDRMLFPYARPDALADMGMVSSFNAAMIRRAVIVCGVMLAIELGA